MSGSNCCFLTCIQISQEAGQVVWYSQLLKNFPQFIVIHTVTWHSQNQNSVGEGDGNQLQYSCLENPMDGGAWWATVHGVTKSLTRLSDCTFTFHFHGLEKEIATHSGVLPGESQGRGSLVGCRLWGHTESDTTEAT